MAARLWRNQTTFASRAPGPSATGRPFGGFLQDRIDDLGLAGHGGPCVIGTHGLPIGGDLRLDDLPGLLGVPLEGVQLDALQVGILGPAQLPQLLADVAQIAEHQLRTLAREELR